MQICKQCGFENDDTAVFCANCGNFLQWTADDEGGTRSQIASAAPEATAKGVRPRGNRRRPPAEGTPGDRPPLPPATEDVSTPAPVPPPPSPSAETGIPASASSAETPGPAPDAPDEAP